MYIIIWYDINTLLMTMYEIMTLCKHRMSNASHASNASKSSASMSRRPSYFCWFKGLSRELTAWIPFNISSNIIPNKYRIMIKYELKNNSVKITRLYRVILLSVWVGLHNYNVCKGWGREILRDCQQERPCIWTHSFNSKCDRIWKLCW